MEIECLEELEEEWVVALVSNRLAHFLVVLAAVDVRLAVVLLGLA